MFGSNSYVLSFKVLPKMSGNISKGNGAKGKEVIKKIWLATERGGGMKLKKNN